MIHCNLQIFDENQRESMSNQKQSEIIEAAYPSWIIPFSFVVTMDLFFFPGHWNLLESFILHTVIRNHHYGTPAA